MVQNQISSSKQEFHEQKHLVDETGQERMVRMSQAAGKTTET